VRAQVYQIDIPFRFKGCSWQELYVHLVENLMLPLALFRDRHPRPPYVYTNPKKSVIISPQDKVFILAQKEPVMIDITEPTTVSAKEEDHEGS
jgi:hypothetical protein